MIENRIPKYLILLISSLIIPFIVAMVIIVLTGDRTSGMGYFPIPAILLIHLSFAFQIKCGRIKKASMALLAILIAAAITSIPLILNFTFNIDMYGFSSLIIFYAIGTVSAWEILFQIDARLPKKKE